eukprot:1161189-Pelagomonas_calceolata.AAC.13
MLKLARTFAHHHPQKIAKNLLFATSGLPFPVSCFSDVSKGTCCQYKGYKGGWPTARESG